MRVDQEMQSSLSASSGQCVICGDVFRLVKSSGVLWKHGWGDGHPPCAGSGLLPSIAADAPCVNPILSASTDSLNDARSPTGEGPTLRTTLFQLKCPTGNILKRIPQGARLRASVVFEACLRKVLHNVDDFKAWQHLFLFPTCLYQPARGGKRHSLTSRVLSQILIFEDGGLVESKRGFGQQSRKTVKDRAKEVPCNIEAAKRCSIKLGDGDIRGAVRVLCSSESYRAPDEHAFSLLKLKHPPRPPDRRPDPTPSTAPASIGLSEVLAAVKSFSPGTSAGVDGLRPQHLLDMIDWASPGTLGEAMVDFTNMVLSGGVPKEVRPTFFGGKLHALGKSDGGVRPIAVGMTLRRLVAKVANRFALEASAHVLLPRQLGVGVKGGCEAAVHSARAYFSSMSEEKAMVKLDFSNAFNSIRRDSVLEAISRYLPHLLPFVTSAYSEDSLLHFGDFFIPSQEGVQQGDPLGPLLFSLTLADVLNDCSSEFVMAYLDDVTLGDTVERLATQVGDLEERASRIGLSLNHTKSEMLGCTGETATSLKPGLLGFRQCISGEEEILGSPIQEIGVAGALAKQRVCLQLLTSRLPSLSIHEGFFLLGHALAMPRLMFLLRSSLCFNSPEAVHFDAGLRVALSCTTNCEISDAGWSQAVLPVRFGGLGIQSVQNLAAPAFLASLHASRSAAAMLTLPTAQLAFDCLREKGLKAWKLLVESSVVVPGAPTKQRSWFEPVGAACFDTLMANADEAGRARLLAGSSPHSGAWINALPSATLGLRLGNDEARIAVGLRIGAKLVLQHQCICGVEVLPDGHHGLSCRRSMGRHSRHTAINGIIARAFQSAGTPTALEPPGLIRGDGKRPDGVTLAPWSSGRTLLWDFTCSDTLAPSHVTKSSVAAGSAASEAEVRKSTKYAALLPMHDFCPFVVETLGVWGPEAASLVSELGRRTFAATGEARSALYLRQRIDIALQRGNAASIMGTLRQFMLPDE